MLLASACSGVEDLAEPPNTTWVPFENPSDPENDMSLRYYEIGLAMDEAFGPQRLLVSEMFSQYAWSDSELRAVALDYPTSSGESWSSDDFVSYLSMQLCVDMADRRGEWPELLTELGADFAASPRPGLDPRLMVQAVIAVAGESCRDLLIAEGVVAEVVSTEQPTASADGSADADGLAGGSATPSTQGTERSTSDGANSGTSGPVEETEPPVDPVAVMEMSARADDITHVAERILEAIVASDEAELVRWAMFSLPDTAVSGYAPASLRCEVASGRCNVDLDDGSSVVMGLEYGGGGWSGWSFSIAGNEPDFDSNEHCDFFNAAGACLFSADGIESCGTLGVEVFGDDDIGYCPEITRIQAALVSQGMSVDIDGYFGLGTQQAVMNFQRFNGLEPDGLVGPQTWASLSTHEPSP